MSHTIFKKLAPNGNKTRDALIYVLAESYVEEARALEKVKDFQKAVASAKEARNIISTKMPLDIAGTEAQAHASNANTALVRFINLSIQDVQSGIEKTQKVRELAEQKLIGLGEFIPARSITISIPGLGAGLGEAYTGGTHDFNLELLRSDLQKALRAHMADDQFQVVGMIDEVPVERSYSNGTDLFEILVAKGQEDQVANAMLRWHEIAMTRLSEESVSRIHKASPGNVVGKIHDAIGAYPNTFGGGMTVSSESVDEHTVGRYQRDMNYCPVIFETDPNTAGSVSGQADAFVKSINKIYPDAGFKHAADTGAQFLDAFPELRQDARRIQSKLGQGAKQESDLSL